MNENFTYPRNANVRSAGSPARQQSSGASSGAIDQRLLAALAGLVAGVGLTFGVMTMRSPAPPVSVVAMEPTRPVEKPPIAVAAHALSEAEANASATERGYGAMTRGAVDEALRLFEEGLQKNPNDAGAVFGLGWALQSRGEFARAETKYRDAALLAEKTGASEIRYYTVYNLGMLYAQQGHPDTAAASFKEAAVIGESNGSKVTDRVWTALYNLGRNLIDAGRPAEAIEPLERAVKLKDTEAAIQFELGRARWKTGKRAEAEDAFLEATHRDPTYAAVVARLKQPARPSSTP